jgi:hypothetical protein
MHASQIRRAAMVVMSFAALVSGCSGNRSATPYLEAVSDVESMLKSKVDAGIMPFTKDADDGKTSFRFIEGDRREKVDHATPLRITITITPQEDGHASTFEIEAYEHGIKLRTRDTAAENRWTKAVARALQRN